MNQVLDSHWHVYSHVDSAGNDYRRIIQDFQKENGLCGINICSIPIYQDLGPGQNLLAAVYKLSDPNSYAYGGIVYPEKPFQKPMPAGMDPLTQYRELMEIGFDGIKMLETKPLEQKQYSVRIDDEYFDPFFAACERDGTHMIWHVADPATFWDIDRIPKRFLDRGWFYGDGTYLSYDETYAQVYRVLERHPNLKVTFAHFFFLSESPEKLEQLFERFPGVTVDITPGAEMYADFRTKRAYYKEFFTKYADRIIFGTDTAFKDGDMLRFAQRIDAVRRFLTTEEEVKVIVETCPGLNLPQTTCEKILQSNFLRDAGAVPKQVDRAKLKLYLEKYCPYISDADQLAFFERELG